MSTRYKIAIDTSIMDGRHAKGTGIQVRKLLEGLVQYKNEFDITLIHKQAAPEEEVYAEFKEIVIPRISLPKFSGFVSELYFFLTTKHRFDLYFVAYSRVLPSFFFAPAKKIMFFPMDGGPQTAGYTGGAKTPFPWYVRWGKSSIDAFLALTEFGKQGLVYSCGVPENKIHIVPPGISSHFKPSGRSKEVVQQYLKDAYGIPAPYILDVSRFDPHKNILRVLDVYNELRNKGVTDASLVFVGGRHMPVYSKTVDVRIAQSAYSSNIYVAPFIPECDLPLVYEAAEVLFFPSLYEGFGMPVAEALACGTPIVTSNLASLPEVSMGCAELVDPYDIQDMVKGMALVLAKGSRVSERIHKGLEAAEQYRWENAVTSLVRVFRVLRDE